MNIKLNNKTAVVCGSTQGIGKASAVELSKLGATIVLVARNEQALVNTIKELDYSQHQQHKYIVADFNLPHTLKTKIQEFIQQNGPAHILVNNTGGPPAGPILKANEDDFIKAFNNHLLCNHLMLQSLIDGMKNEKYGRIINIISTSVKAPIKNLGVSNTTRGAVASWAKTMSMELAPYGITVNNVLPGLTLTGRLQALIENTAATTGLSKEQVTKNMLSEIPFGRFADASEIANAVAFLASPSAAYITGISIAVDGGKTPVI